MLVVRSKSNLGCEAGCGLRFHSRIMLGSWSDHSRIIESSRVESSRVESSRIVSRRVESSRVESSRVESSRVESSRVGQVE